MRDRPLRRQSRWSIFRYMKGLRRDPVSAGLEIEGRIATVLADVAPLLRIEHCSVELFRFDPASGHLVVSIRGNCPDCAGSPAMFATAIEAHVKQRIPEVREVILQED